MKQTDRTERLERLLQTVYAEGEDVGSLMSYLFAKQATTIGEDEGVDAKVALAWLYKGDISDCLPQMLYQNAALFLE